jgi:hypothetical protein
VTVQVSAAPHAATLQPVSVEVSAGWAVSVSEEPAAAVAVQVPGQSIPVPVTVPLPVPANWTATVPVVATG